MRNLLIAVFILLLSCAATWAAPTPRDCCLAWDNDEPEWAGIFVYFALEAEPSPRQYTDTRRVDAGLVSTGFDIKTVLPNVKGSLCFRLTAYDDVGNESAFSEEACGWFGMGRPVNFDIRAPGE